MAGADYQGPIPDSGPGSDAPVRPQRQARRTGGVTSPVLLIYGLLLLLWIALAAEAAYQRQWISFAGYTVVAVVFLVIPTGAMRRLGQSVPGRPRVAEHPGAAASDRDPPGSTTS
jgi:hypothetical protein